MCNYIQVGSKAMRRKFENTEEKFSCLKTLIKLQLWLLRDIQYVYRAFQFASKIKLAPSKAAFFIQEPNKILFQKISCVHLLWKFSKEVQLSLLSASNDRLRTKSNTTSDSIIDDLLTSTLFTVLKNLAVDALLSAAFFYEPIPAILPEDHKLTIWKSTPVVIVKQHDVSTGAVFTRDNPQNADMKTHFKAKYDEGLAIEN